MIINMQDELKFKSNIDALKDSTKNKFKNVNYKFLRRDYNTSIKEEQKIKENLEFSGDYTRYGLIQAITATARDLNNIQRSIHLEKLGGKLLHVSNSQWNNVIL